MLLIVFNNKWKLYKMFNSFKRCLVLLVFMFPSISFAASYEIGGKVYILSEDKYDQRGFYDDDYMYPEGTYVVEMYPTKVVNKHDQFNIDPYDANYYVYYYQKVPVKEKNPKKNTEILSDASKYPIYWD